MKKYINKGNRKLTMLRKSQMWSLDSMIAMFVFIAAIVAFIVLLSVNIIPDRAETLKEESNLIPRLVSNPENVKYAIINDNTVDKEVVKSIQDLYTYDEIKDLIGTKSDFCIYFEDDEGYLLNMSYEVGSSSTDVGIGDGRITLTSSNIKCSS
jgi:hypothetical protein